MTFRDFVRWLFPRYDGQTVRPSARPRIQADSEERRLIREVREVQRRLALVKREIEDIARNDITDPGHTPPRKV